MGGSGLPDRRSTDAWPSGVRDGGLESADSLDVLGSEHRLSMRPEPATAIEGVFPAKWRLYGAPRLDGRQLEAGKRTDALRRQAWRLARRTCKEMLDERWHASEAEGRRLAHVPDNEWQCRSHGTQAGTSVIEAMVQTMKLHVHRLARSALIGML